jgi:DNA-binding NarL/FixJ family response regulator
MEMMELPCSQFAAMQSETAARTGGARTTDVGTGRQAGGCSCGFAGAGPQDGWAGLFELVSSRVIGQYHARPAMKVVLIEDQVMFRDLLKKICRDHLHLTVVGEADDAANGLALCRKHRPDIVLLDLNLPDKDGITMADELLAINPDVRILAVSTECDDYTLYRVLNSGVHGYVDKNRQSVEVLKHAIDEVVKGRVFFTEVVQEVRQRLRAEPTSFPKMLTEREQELLALLGGGLSNDEVARELHLSRFTVQLHRRNIMSKLGLHRTPDLIRYAVNKGFSKLNSFRERNADPP